MRPSPLSFEAETRRYAIAAAVMVEPDADVPAVAARAEELAARISDRLLSEGLPQMLARLQSSFENCLAAWTVRQPCSFSAFTDLWRNVRFQTEDVSHDSLPAPGEVDSIVESLMFWRVLTKYEKH